MGAVMHFLPGLRKFLNEHGEIYTVRRYRMGAANVTIDGVGVCRRTPMGVIHDMEQLRPYVALSGFGTVEDWWEKILSFIPETFEQSRVAKYLYHVVKV
jgi:hypothetical protein